MLVLYFHRASLMRKGTRQKGPVCGLTWTVPDFLTPCPKSQSSIYCLAAMIMFLEPKWNKWPRDYMTGRELFGGKERMRHRNGKESKKICSSPFFFSPHVPSDYSSLYSDSNVDDEAITDFGG